MAAFKASGQPICRSASRSNSSPASEVIGPPGNSATSRRRVVLEKASGWRLRSVIAVVLGVEGRLCGNSFPYQTLNHRATHLRATPVKYLG